MNQSLVYLPPGTFPVIHFIAFWVLGNTGRIVESALHEHCIRVRLVVRQSRSKRNAPFPVQDSIYLPVSETQLRAHHMFSELSCAV